LPLIDLTFPAGAIEGDARDSLIEDLTTKMLEWEGAPDTEFFRNITWVHVHELAEGAANAAGKPVEQPIFRIDVTVPDGALSERRKGGLVEDLTKAVIERAGLAEDAGLRVWVLIREVPEGNWGAAGQVVRFAQLREAAAAEREKQAVASG
jgi:phenylpyruvate tautomerase PptA (4-oxalocrotonate tautomerase family)